MKGNYESEEFREWVNTLKEIPIVDVIDAYGIEARTKGGRVSILCPEHDDHNYGSCVVSKDRNTYYCFACGAHGSSIRLLQKQFGWGFMTTVNSIAEMFGLPKFDTNSDNGKPFPLTEKQIKYLGLKSSVRDIMPFSVRCEKPQSGEYFHDGENYVEYTSETVTLLSLFKEDEVTFNYIVIGKLFHTLVDLIISHSVEKTWEAVKFYQKEIKEDLEDRIETLLPLAEYYKDVAPGYGYNFSFVTQYHKGNPVKAYRFSVKKELIA